MHVKANEMPIPAAARGEQWRQQAAQAPQRGRQFSDRSSLSRHNPE
jgi:hypothetical protein